MSLDADTERKISHCVSEVLETLGKNGKQALTHYLDTNMGLKKEEILQKPELFSKGLDLIFGEQGADVLETAIVRKLQTSFGLVPKSKLTFVEAIGIIRVAQKRARKT
jgi:hypothetical protein